jgi:hypothetical protein
MFDVGCSISAFCFQRFSFSLVPPSTLNPKLLCRGNRLLLQRAATATLWDREAGTRVSEVSTATDTESRYFSRIA